MSLTWRKSSYSGGAEEHECIEVAFAQQVHIRDSKNTEGPRLTFSPAAWRAFLQR